MLRVKNPLQLGISFADTGLSATRNAIRSRKSSGDRSPVLFQAAAAAAAAAVGLNIHPSIITRRRVRCGRPGHASAVPQTRSGDSEVATTAHRFGRTEPLPKALEIRKRISIVRCYGRNATFRLPALHGDKQDSLTAPRRGTEVWTVSSVDFHGTSDRARLRQLPQIHRSQRRTGRRGLLGTLVRTVSDDGARICRRGSGARACSAPCKAQHRCRAGARRRICNPGNSDADLLQSRKPNRAAVGGNEQIRDRALGAFARLRPTKCEQTAVFSCRPAESTPRVHARRLVRQAP